MKEKQKYWMSLAIEEASRAENEGEVPVGAVAVLEEQVVAREHNRSIQLNDPTAHAEILLLRKVGEIVQNYRLRGVQIYVTLEPCVMCAGALIWARVDRLVFGACDHKAGAVRSQARILEPGRFNHTVPVIEGILEPQCRQILQKFFRRRRDGTVSDF